MKVREWNLLKKQFLQNPSGWSSSPHCSSPQNCLFKFVNKANPNNTLVIATESKRKQKRIGEDEKALYVETQFFQQQLFSLTPAYILE